MNYDAECNNCGRKTMRRGQTVTLSKILVIPKSFTGVDILRGILSGDLLLSIAEKVLSAVRSAGTLEDEADKLASKLREIANKKTITCEFSTAENGPRKRFILQDPTNVTNTSRPSVVETTLQNAQLTLTEFAPLGTAPTNVSNVASNIVTVDVPPIIVDHYNTSGAIPLPRGFCPYQEGWSTGVNETRCVCAGSHTSQSTCNLIALLTNGDVNGDSFIRGICHPIVCSKRRPNLPIVRVTVALEYNTFADQSAVSSSA